MSLHVINMQTLRTLPLFEACGVDTHYYDTVNYLRASCSLWDEYDFVTYDEGLYFDEKFSFELVDGHWRNGVFYSTPSTTDHSKLRFVLNHESSLKLGLEPLSRSFQIWQEK